MDYIQIKIDRRKNSHTPTHTISKKQTHLSVCTRLNKHSTIAVLSSHLGFITRNISAANARRAESKPTAARTSIRLLQGHSPSRPGERGNLDPNRSALLSFRTGDADPRPREHAAVPPDVRFCVLNLRDVWLALKWTSPPGLNLPLMFSSPALLLVYFYIWAEVPLSSRAYFLLAIC